MTKRSECTCPCHYMPDAVQHLVPCCEPDPTPSLVEEIDQYIKNKENWNSEHNVMGSKSFGYLKRAHSRLRDIEGELEEEKLRVKLLRQDLAMYEGLREEVEKLPTCAVLKIIEAEELISRKGMLALINERG